MISLFNVRTVSRFESKTLLRSWFFRIFAGVGFFFLLMFNMFAVAAIGDGAWPGRLVPSAVPYFNMWMLNIAQAIIAVFLSADFLGRDKKLDTTEAFYVRSMSNMDYVIGKTIGIMKVFLVLNVIVLFLGILFTLIGNEVPVNWTSFLIYPLLISLPTLVFVLGLSFFVMTLIRNQAITFVLMLGFIALSLFYIRNKWFGIFDFLGFFTPFMRSDFTGFGNESDLLFIRLGILLLGVVFILATVWRLPRLEQQKYSKVTLVVSMSIMFSAGIGLLLLKANRDYGNTQLRVEINTLNEGLKDSPYKIKAYDVDLKHSEKSIACIATLNLELEDKKNELVLALNPGLKVSKISSGTNQLQFERKGHLIIVKTSLVQSQSFDLKIEYDGQINDMAMYPEVDEEALLSLNRLDPILANKQFSFINPNYVLLTREANWYPVVASKLYWTRYPFTEMNLNVSTKNGLTVISQGNVVESDNGVWQFSPEQKLNAYSLVIGQYDHLRTTVDSIEFNLYHHKKHDFFKPYFTELSDTASHIIKGIKDDFERKLGVKYPFKRFSVIESPINMYSYLRNWSLATESVMPEMVLFPESGGGTWQNDLSRKKERIEDRSKDNNEDKSEKEVQVEVLKSYIGDNFIKPQRFFFGRRQDGERSVENWGRYQVFPNYFTYSNSVEEDGYPLLTIAMENYLHKRLSETQRRGLGGLSPNDEVILKLREKSLADLIKDEDVNTLGNVFASKGSQLLSNLKVNNEEGSFDTDLDEMISESRFKNVSLSEFSITMDELAQTDFSNLYGSWLNDQDIPAFLFGSINVWEVKEGNRIRYFMKVPVSNHGEVDGILSFTIREGQRRGGGRGGRFRSRFGMDGDDDSNNQSFVIKKGETSDIGFMLDDLPREVQVETYLAKNIPSSQRLETNDVITDQKKIKYFEGKSPSNTRLKHSEDFEIIVDNEDESCTLVNTGESRTIKDWWASKQNQDEESDTYGMIRFWNPPVKWKPVAGQDFYGEYLKSAFYKRKGSGAGYVSWKASIEDTGNYDVYAYVPDIRGGRRRKGGNSERDYHYTVYHDDGVEEIETAITSENSGWVYLGEFYFSDGEAEVRLSDTSTKSEYIIADAVKWVKK